MTEINLSKEPSMQILSMAEEWEMFHTWLEANAPGTLLSLNPPASESEIERLGEIGHFIHPDLPSLLCCHNGAPPVTRGGAPSAYLPGGYSLKSVDQILIGRTVMLEDIEYERRRGTLVDNYGLTCHSDWLPIASDSAGGQLFLDNRTGPLLGSVLAYDDGRLQYQPKWPSLRSMLSEINSSARGHGTAGGLKPRVRPGELTIEWYDPQFS
ncbi:SMI1/KNR4 family protein [Streptomyces flavotricini]|uniref:SMI1/KNR4 family protein n=1 Tax=Streptomyces flavotricini TaxID=66888 RepID=A0ABS8E9E1_9ACTN|nr:SMI1/KNR4 family protein [Streptomyces flavotricini]MCC0097681.1 SMI1/KNR4 family protein [Streptomyces flavotricini]